MPAYFEILLSFPGLLETDHFFRMEMIKTQKILISFGGQSICIHQRSYAMKKMRRFFVGCLLISYLPLAGGNIDSLKGLVTGAEPGEKARIYNELFRLSGPYMFADTARLYAEKALENALLAKDSFNAAYASRNLGMYYSTRSQYPKSIEWYRKAIGYLATSDDLRRVTVTYNELGNTLINSIQYDEAGSLLFEALKRCEDANYTSGIVMTSQNIGNLYRQLGKTDESIVYLDRALSLELAQDKPNSRTLRQLYKTIGLIRHDQGNYTEAILALEKALNVNQQSADNRELMMIHNSIALSLSSMGNHEEAMVQYHLAKKMADLSQNQDLITAAQLNIGREYMITGNYRKAIREIETGLELARKYNFTKWLRNGYRYLYDSYNRLDDAENALINYVKHREYDDSLKIQETQVKIAELETRYETEKKEKQIELLNKENEIQTLKLRQNRIAIMLLALLISLISLAAVLYFQRLKQKQRIREISRKQELEKNLMSAVISTEERERKRIATELHDGLGPLLSSIKLYLSGLEGADESSREEWLQNTRNLADESISSLRSISNNILPAELTEKGLIHSLQHFAGKLMYTRQIEIRIEDQTRGATFDPPIQLIIYRVIQELLNNTLKHARASTATIMLTRQDAGLQIDYQDDGKGFDYPSVVSNQDPGMGLNNIRQRIENLNGTISIQTAEGQGTRVTMHLSNAFKMNG